MEAENLYPKEPTWRNIVGLNCPITGTPVPLLFQHLYRLGLTAKELVHLEDLSDPKVLAKMGKKRMKRDNSKSLVNYLRAWADLLTEHGADDVARSSNPVRQIQTK